jgi:choline-glycine betaine transporter
MTSVEDPPKTLDDENPKEIEVVSAETPSKYVESGDDSDLASDLEKPSKKETPPREFPLRQVKFGPISFNPAVSLIGLVPLWALAGYCINNPDDASSLLNTWFATVIDLFTWFYIVANPVLTFFICWVAYRYGHIKLGKKDDEPEFSNASYFAMIFSAGVGVGLFFYGVSEPLWHREPDNYFSNAGYHSQNEIDQYSLIITLYHWGFAGWSPYLVVAIACGLASYQFGLPMTIRSTFYPMLGEYTWGWMGDAIDGYSIVMTVAGVCTSLGLGAIQIIAGCQDLGWVDPDREDLTPVFVILIWCITIAATISVVSGLDVGIKTLANIGFGLGNIILFLCFVMEKTDYLLNLLVQTTGVYLQNNIFQVPFWTDAFGALNEGEGRAVDGNSSASWFIGSWTVFYMAWWVAWACFVGMFIARISKNRTLREVIVSVFLCPTIYAIVWFSFMGGIGLRQQRQAMELQKVGETSFGDAGHFLVDGSEFCFDVPQEDVMVNGTSVFSNLVPGITPVCLFDRANDAQSWFNVMNSFSYPDSNDFGGFGPFLSGLSIFTLAIYFITSSDSGSLVVDTLASNGASDHHWIQRVFWAVTEGAVACALLVAGKEQALKALQASSIVIGLPFNLFLFVMCMTIVQMCNAIEKNQNEDNPDPTMMVPTEKQTWSMPLFGGIFNIFEFVFALGLHNESRKEKGMHQPVVGDITYFLVALIFPFIPLYNIYTSDVIDPKQKNKWVSVLSTAVYAICFVAWIVMFGFGAVNRGFVAFGWTLFFANSFILASLRMHFRKVLGYKGNFVGDITASSFLYPQALYQMLKELDSENAKAFVAANHDE